MKKKIAFATALLILVPLSVFAYETYSHIVGCGINTIPKFIKALLAIVIKVGIPVASIFLIWAGFLFLTAQGNESKLASAKKTFIWACIGFGVVLAAWLFALAFQTILTSFSGGQPQDATLDPCNDSSSNPVLGVTAGTPAFTSYTTPPPSTTVPPPGSGGTATPAKPNAPTQLRASSVGSSRSQLQLSWSPSTSPNIIGYNVYQNKTMLGTTAGTSFVFPVSNSALGYMYTVVAVNSTGAASLPSSPLFTSVSSLPNVASSVVPTSNTLIPIVSSNVISPSSAELSWTPVSGATGYTVYRNGTPVGTVSGTSYTDNSVSPGMFIYTVAANIGSQIGSPSMQTYVFVKGAGSPTSTPDAAAPSVPSGLTGALVSASQIDIKWTASTDNSDFVGYKIYRDGNQIGYSSSPSYMDVNAFAPSTTYTYKVLAFDASGNESAMSASVSVTTPAPPPPPDSGSGSGDSGGGSSIPPFSPLPASACTKIVNAGGSIQSALSGAGPGTVVCVHGGTYNQTVSVSSSGNSSSPIIIQAYPGESVIIDGQKSLPSGSWGALVNINGNYVRMYGFEVKNTSSNNSRGVAINGHHNTVSHFNVHHSHQNGILAGGDYSIVEDSRVWTNALSNVNGSSGMWAGGLNAARDPVNGISDGVIFRRNIVFNNWGEGLSSFEASGTLIENNIVYNNWSVNLYVSDSKNVIVRNNLVYNASPNQASARPGSLTMADERADKPRSDNVQVTNNIVYGTNLCVACWTIESGLNNINANHNTVVNGSIRMDTSFGTRISQSANCTLTASQVPGLGTVTPGSLTPAKFANASCPSGTGAVVSQFSTQ
jgi:parallel beta-helix repeat protein